MKYNKTKMCWSNMKGRCNNPNIPHYRFYGKKGITYDPKWEQYSGFVEDMGEVPDGMTLDRIDVKGNYTKKNCKWSTTEEQSNNKTTTRYLTYKGRTMSMSYWAKEFGLIYRTLQRRLEIGWSLERSLTAPVTPGNTRPKNYLPTKRPPRRG